MNSPKIISFLLPHFSISGGVKAAMEYANRLHKLGHSVNLIAPTPRKKGIQKILGCFKEEKVREIESKAIPWFKLECALMEIPSLHPQWLPEADIHVATSWETAAPIEEAASKSGRGFYLVQHHESLWTRDKMGAENSYSLGLRKMVISTWLLEIMKKKYNSDSLLIVTPVNQNHFFPEPGVEPDPFRVAMLHHHYDWKGFPDAMEAVRMAQGSIPELKPVVFGSKIKNVDLFLKETNFPCEYHFSPPVDQLRNLYSSCGLFLCSSWHEGLGMPAMEAMACGSALVTTDTGGCWDYALPKKTALVLPPKNPEMLAAGIVSLMKNRELRETLAGNGMKKVKEFSWEENTDKMVDYFFN